MTFGMAGGDRGFDPLVLLLMAIVVEAYIGEAERLFKTVPHPVRIIGNAIGFFDRKLNRETRSQVDRAFRGALVVAFRVASRVKGEPVSPVNEIEGASLST